MNSRDQKGRLAVLGCAVGIFWSGSLIFAYPGLMGPYWRQHFHVDAAATGKVMMFVLFALGTFMFISGKLHVMLGTKKCMRIGTLILVAAMLVLNFAQNIYMVYVWAFLNGSGSCFFYGPGLTTVQKWFPQRRGLVTGIVTLIFGISGAVMAPILHVMIKSMGYEMMNYAVIAMLIVFTLLASLVSEMPEKANLTKEEAAAHEELMASVQAKAAASTQKQAVVSFTVVEALKTKSFWLLWLTWCFAGAAGISMVGLSVSYPVSLGLSGVVVIMAFNLTNGLSRLISGTLSDYIGGNITGCIAFTLSGVAYFLLPKFTGISGIAIMAAVVGFGLGTLFSITAPMASKIFGLKYFGMIFGLMFTAYGFVSAIVGPAVGGYILKRNGGNFVPVFTYLGVFSLLSAVCIFLARPEKKPVTQAAFVPVEGH